MRSTDIPKTGWLSPWSRRIRDVLEEELPGEEKFAKIDGGSMDRKYDRDYPSLFRPLRWDRRGRRKVEPRKSGHRRVESLSAGKGETSPGSDKVYLREKDTDHSDGVPGVWRMGPFICRGPDQSQRNDFP